MEESEGTWLESKREQRKGRAWTMKKKFRFQWGAFLMFLVYGGLFFLLFGRILFIQVTGQAEGKVMATLAESKYARESVLKADRGTIVDRNGELIASDTLSYRLIAVLSKDASKGSKKPLHITDIEKTAEVLAEYIPLEKDAIVSRLTDAKAGINIKWNLERLVVILVTKRSWRLKSRNFLDFFSLKTKKDIIRMEFLHRI